MKSDSAPSARIAAIAKEESSSSASIAPCVAIMADTPQTAEPTARREISLGRNPNLRPRNVMNAMATTSSTDTSARLTPPSLTTSPSRNREPSNTIPALSQNSYVATPARKISGTPTVFVIARPIRMAHRTYSIFGNERW